MTIFLLNGTAVSQKHGDVCTELGKSTFARHGCGGLKKCLVPVTAVFTIMVVRYLLGNCLHGTVNQYLLGNCVRGN